MTKYTLTRSKRKTIGLYIKDGNLEIRTPLYCPQSEIDRFITLKEKWINDKLYISRKHARQKANFSLSYGNYISFRGILYPLAAKTGDKSGFDGECFYFPPMLKPDLLRDACINVYHSLAKKHLKDRVKEYAEQMGVTPASVKINNAKGRWGSCSSQKSLNFSWRLIMAEDDVIDYVVVHELAHIIEMNHSQKFWAVVDSVLPDYLERKSQLKKLQIKLVTEDWG